MSAEKDSPDTWVYDYAVNKEGKIIAINYHYSTTNGGYCMKLDVAALEKEGLSVGLSKSFSSLKEATAHAWTEKDRFSQGLD